MFRAWFPNPWRSPNRAAQKSDIGCSTLRVPMLLRKLADSGESREISDRHARTTGGSCFGLLS